MTTSAQRLFLPQATVDDWLERELAVLEDDALRVSAIDVGLRLHSAVRFMEDVADGTDAHALVGKVKTIDALASFGGEHYADSVIVADSAYSVVEGFLGELVSTEGDVDAEAALGAKLVSWLQESVLP